MKVAAKNESDALSYKVAQKLLDEMIKKLLDRVFQANGIPLPLASLHKKLFSQYGKLMVELYRSTIKYDAQWTGLRDVTMHLDRSTDDIFAYIKSSPTVAADPFGPAILFEALVSPQSAVHAIAEKERLKKAASELVEKFDGILSGQEEILAFTTAMLKRLNIFLESDFPQNNFDVAIGRGSLTVGAGNVCYCASKYHEAYAALLRHRNEWAAIASVGRRRARTLGELSSLCPM